MNTGPLEEQQVLLTADLLHRLNFSWIVYLSILYIENIFNQTSASFRGKNVPFRTGGERAQQLVKMLSFSTMVLGPGILNPI